MMTHYPTPDHARLAAEGMYRPDLESDACGVGMVAATDGKASRRVVEAAIEALRAVWHRGAVDADGKTGDGAGIYTFSAVVGDAASSTFDFTMTLGSNVGVPSPASFVSFNPQPDIPGYSGDQGFAFSYAGDIDATLSIQVSHDGVPLSFAQVPEPGSLLAMVPAGVLVARRRRRAG